jgi:hypothetical protein
MLHVIGTVTKLTVILLIGCIQNMQIIHSQNQRQAIEVGVMATRR